MNLLVKNKNKFEKLDKLKQIYQNKLIKNSFEHQKI